MKDYARILSKGKSIEYSKWKLFTKYSNDFVKQDIVSCGTALLVCKKTHLSEEGNKPEIVYDDEIEQYLVTGAAQEYWDIVFIAQTKEDFDKLAEIVQNIKEDYLKSADKAALEGKIAAAQSAANAAQNAADAAQGDVDAIAADYLKSADKTELDGKITDAKNIVYSVASDLNTEIIRAKNAEESLQKNKQDNLKSGVNIKTINGEELVGEGNVDLPVKKGAADDTMIFNGVATDATAIGAISFGYKSTANGKYSFAEGGETVAKGNYSHAEGNETTASGGYSHAEGHGSQAQGESSHAEGYQTIAYGQHSHAEGHSEFSLEEIGENLTKEDYIRIWDASSKKFGMAYGKDSHAEGINTLAVGARTHAEGTKTKASGESSHAEGTNTVSSGNYSHAEGDSTQAIGKTSHAEGKGAQAKGDFSHAEGHSTVTGENAKYSHAEGYSSQANGQGSHAEGGCYNSSDNFIKGGTATGVASHAEGLATEANGRASHAEGTYTTASGDYSHTEGLGTQTTNEAEHASGKYNKSNSNTIFSVGVGTSDSNRKNALEVQTTDGGKTIINTPIDVTGDVTINGDLKTTGKHIIVETKTEQVYELTVDGQTNLLGETVIGTQTNTADLIVTGDTTLQGLNAGTSTLSSLNVVGQTEISNNLTVSGQTKLSENSYIGSISDENKIVKYSDIKDKPSSNEIWYTTTGGKVVTPHKTDVFGANIVSNTYENGKGVITFDGDVTSIGDSAFRNCSSLTSVTIGDSVTSIGDYAFYNCSSLKAFYGKFASSDNRALIVDNCIIAYANASGTSYTIPDSVTEIGNGAFCSCSSLKSVTIPNSVTSIGYRALSSCSSLTSVTIGNGVTSIGEGAFYYCSKLTEVNCKPTTPPTGGWYMFDSNASGRKIYVPVESVDAYKTATNWPEYADYIVGCVFEDEHLVSGQNIKTINGESLLGSGNIEIESGGSGSASDIIIDLEQLYYDYNNYAWESELDYSGGGYDDYSGPTEYVKSGWPTLYNFWNSAKQLTDGAVVNIYLEISTQALDTIQANDTFDLDGEIYQAYTYELPELDYTMYGLLHFSIPLTLVGTDEQPYLESTEPYKLRFEGDYYYFGKKYRISIDAGCALMATDPPYYENYWYQTSEMNNEMHVSPNFKMVEIN